MNRKSNLKGIPILLCTALVWGVAFVAQSAGAEHLSAFSYTAIRYAIGIIPLIPIAFFLELRRCERKTLKRSFTVGSLCGAVMFVAITLQQYGIQLTSNAGKAGFITCLYILIVPIISLFLRQRPALNVWVGVVLAAVGLYLLTVKGNSGVELGDALVMLSAVLWAVHILVVDRVAFDIYSITFSVVQFTVVSALSTACMLVFDTVTLEAVKSAWLPLLYGGLGSVAIGYTLQIIGQKYASPVTASLILSLEAVFASLAGAIFLKENLGTRGYIGSFMIFIAIITAQLPEKLFRAKGKQKVRENNQ